MISAQLHPQETMRIEELLRYEVLDTEDEKALNELTQLASAICGTKISLISLVDKDRQWFKSRVGLDATETPKNIAFCSHAILQEKVFEIPNATEDERFYDNPLVTGAPDIRFYAGAPLVTPSGLPIGTLCVIDPEPNKLTEQQQLALTTLAKQVVSQLELRLHNRQLQRMQKNQQQLFAVMAHDLKNPFSGILGLSKILHKKADTVTPERLATMADGILQSSLTVYQLLDELLQWSRSQLGAVKVDMELIPLAPIIDETVELMQEGLKLKQLSVEQQLDEKAVAFGDANLTKTIVRNLLANAIKYSHKNGHIRIETKQADNEVQLIITDTGEGIPENIKKALFVDSVMSHSGTQGESGHGLGLSLCGDFAARQQGHLTIDNDYKEGAKVILHLQHQPN